MADSNPPPTDQQEQALYDYAHYAPDESDIVKQEMARAQALRKQEVPQPPAYGFGGSFAAGIARGIQNAQAAQMEKRALAQQRQIINQKRANAAVAAGKQPAQAPRPMPQVGTTDLSTAPQGAPPTDLSSTAPLDAQLTASGFDPNAQNLAVQNAIQNVGAHPADADPEGLSAFGM